MSRSDQSGQAYALTVITPIKAGEEGALRSFLEGLPRDASPLARIPGTHFGRWVIVPRFEGAAEGERPAPDELSSQYLVFTSNFDGALDPYLDALCERLAPEAPEIWGRCAGWAGGGDALKDYLVRHSVKTGFFVAAYGQSTLGDVRRALETRERVIDLAVAAQGMAPGELQRAFQDEFGA
jgi:hypothetical protein